MPAAEFVTGLQSPETFSFPPMFFFVLVLFAGLSCIRCAFLRCLDPSKDNVEKEQGNRWPLIRYSFRDISSGGPFEILFCRLVRSAMIKILSDKVIHTSLYSNISPKRSAASTEKTFAMPDSHTQKFLESMDPSQSKSLSTADQFSGLIDTPEAMTSVIDTLVGLPSSPPSLFIDLEGVSLSRHGTVSVLQLLIFPSDRTYLIDIHTLGSKAFHAPGTDGQTTFKFILESTAIPKVFFDVRKDSDALYAHFGISLAAIQDLQLMEMATRRPTLPKKYLNGLAKCIEKDVSLTLDESYRWKTVKEKGRKLFAPECGGNYEVFNARPMSEDVQAYCIQDVKFMPKLWAVYNAKLTSPVWRGKVEKATRDRVVMSQSASFDGNGPHMTFGPWH